MTSLSSFSLVEVALDDEDSDITTVNGAEISCAIDEIIEAAEDATVEQKKQKEANGDIRTSRKRSSIWIHFERMENQRRAVCLICKKKIHHNSNTSNLHRHLSKKHPVAFSELGGTMKKTAPGMLERSKINATKEATVVVEENCSGRSFHWFVNVTNSCCFSEASS